jgi:hypothetical protein
MKQIKITTGKNWDGTYYASAWALVNLFMSCHEIRVGHVVGYATADAAHKAVLEQIG